MAVFDSQTDTTVYDLTSMPCQRARRMGRDADPEAMIVRQTEMAMVITVLGREAYRPTTDRMAGLTEIRGSMTASDGLHLRPRTITKLARPHGWCDSGRRDLCHPAEAARRARTEGRQEDVVYGPDGIVTAIQYRPRTRAEWDATWGRDSRRDDTDPVTTTPPKANTPKTNTPKTNTPKTNTPKKEAA